MRKQKKKLTAYEKLVRREEKKLSRLKVQLACVEQDARPLRLQIAAQQAVVDRLLKS